MDDLDRSGQIPDIDELLSDARKLLGETPETAPQPEADLKSELDPEWNLETGAEPRSELDPEWIPEPIPEPMPEPIPEYIAEPIPEEPRSTFRTALSPENDLRWVLDAEPTEEDTARRPASPKSRRRQKDAPAYTAPTPAKQADDPFETFRADLRAGDDMSWLLEVEERLRAESKAKERSKQKFEFEPDYEPQPKYAPKPQAAPKPQTAPKPRQPSEFRTAAEPEPTVLFEPVSSAEAEEEEVEEIEEIEKPEEPEVYTKPEFFDKPLTFYEQSKAQYQVARRAEYEREREFDQRQRSRRKQQAEQEEQQQPEEPEPNAEEDYSEWLFRQGRRSAPGQEQPEQAGQPPAPKKKMNRGVATVLRIVALLLAVVLLSGGVIHFLLAECPQSAAVYGTRREGVSTILLVGTDQGGFRTDTMMLLSFDREKKTTSLVSIPRDTLIYCEYSVPKLNSAYGWAKGGDKGIRELMKRITEIIGFEPDGYMVFDLDTFEKLVDLMGGVRFNVPMDMDYEDPTQQLYIHLPAGERRLNGAEAQQLVRFRSGYPNADLGRINVQQAFVASALEQWLSAKNLLYVPSALRLVLKSTKTDLTFGKLVWLAESALRCNPKSMRIATLPGNAVDIAGGSYYVLDPEGVAKLVNEMINPYQEEVSARNLSIRVG